MAGDTCMRPCPWWSGSSTRATSWSTPKEPPSPAGEYVTERPGLFANLPLVVMVDEGSASASEIMAGALQDHDRAAIVGRRTFGKGLVQEEFPVANRGALRLTVARYYTPSGRSIQRPYGGGVDYEDEWLQRQERGNSWRPTVLRVDSLAYRTMAGRTVYGGGIAPDVFVPLDTGSFPASFRELVYAGRLREHAFDSVPIAVRNSSPSGCVRIPRRRGGRPRPGGGPLIDDTYRPMRTACVRKSCAANALPSALPTTSGENPPATGPPCAAMVSGRGRGHF